MCIILGAGAIGSLVPNGSGYFLGAEFAKLVTKW